MNNDLRNNLENYIRDLEMEVQKCKEASFDLAYDEICRRTNMVEINIWDSRRDALDDVIANLQSFIAEKQ